MRIQIRPILFRIVLPFCLVLLCGFALVLWQYTRNSGSVRTTIVHLTNQGFEPARIEVKLGETVVFINNSSRKFWPASDLHPTHSIYPEFDAHAAIDPGGRWSFTFSKIGTWRYHDHLAPAARGVVVVHSDGGAGGEPLATNCSAIGTTADKESCWNEAVITLLDSQGVSAALEYVGKLYTTEPSFAADCHDYLHKVGEAVYDRRMDLSGLLGPETSYCGYGFFHGYMERLLAVSGDITEAAKCLI
jgi:plastocyanin